MRHRQLRRALPKPHRSACGLVVAAVVVVPTTEGQCDTREAIPVSVAVRRVATVIRRVIWISVVRPVVAPSIIRVPISAPMTVPHDHPVVSVVRGNDLMTAVPIAAMTVASISFGNNDRQQRQRCQTDDDLLHARFDTENAQIFKINNLQNSLQTPLATL